MKSTLLVVAALGFGVAPLSLEAAPTRCSVTVGELVPTAEVARGVAEAVISGRQSPEKRAGYVLHVARDERDPSKWAVWQGLHQPPPNADGSVTIALGGGGLSMRIDRCTGKIGRVRYVR